MNITTYIEKKLTIDDFLWMRRISDGIHRCAFCEHAYIMGLNILETTRVYHACPLCELNDFDEAEDAHPNTKAVYFRNSEFYITECPNFEPIKNYGEIYYHYLETFWWREKAAEIKQRDSYKCKLCGSGINLVVHHTSYDHVGCERDDELVTVCQHCHEHIHSEDINRKE